MNSVGCCSAPHVSGHDRDHIIGKVLDMSTEDIWNGQSADPICAKRVSTGMARWIYFQQELARLGDKPWPRGAGDAAVWESQ